VYNLIVTACEGAWDEPQFAIEVGRFLEYTDDAVKARFQALDDAVIASLVRLPTVFAYERGGGPARVGWITALRVRQEEIRISFALDEAVAPFTTADIDAHAWEFDVNRYETYRTHWAVKDVDLFEALAEAGLGAVAARDRRLPVPPYAAEVVGAVPVADARNEVASAPLAINPSIFRVPTGGVHATVVAIMMPFDKSFDAVHEAIRATCGAAGFEGRRVDNMWEDTTIVQDIFSLIYCASIAVVDFTGRNPNVFYETGIAHTLGKHVVPITQSDADVPFDLRHHRYLRYLPNGEGLEELTSKLKSRLITLAHQMSPTPTARDSKEEAVAGIHIRARRSVARDGIGAAPRRNEGDPAQSGPRQERACE
jgi:hypothetical protein